MGKLWREIGWSSSSLDVLGLTYLWFFFFGPSILKPEPQYVLVDSEADLL